MQQSRRNLDAFLRSLPARDWATIATTMTPDVKRHGIEDNPDTDAVQGRDAYIAWLSGFADPLYEYGWTIHRILFDEDTGAATVMCSTHYRVRADDVPFGYRLAMVFGFDSSGLIDSVDLYWKTPAKRMPGDTIRQD
jgi:hypothetical protein